MGSLLNLKLVNVPEKENFNFVIKGKPEWVKLRAMMFKYSYSGEAHQEFINRGKIEAL